MTARIGRLATAQDPATEPVVSEETELDGYAGALAGVHAAIWGYGRLIALLDADQDRALRAFDGYRGLRDRLTNELVDAGVEPPAAEPAYALPDQLTDADSARQLAAHLEQGCADVFAHLVSVAVEPRTRMFAARTLGSCTRRAVAWGGPIEAFPGIPDA